MIMRGYYKDSSEKFFDVSREKTAVIVMDVQREFCDPKYRINDPNYSRGSEHTHFVASKIVDLVREFRRAKIKTITVYADINNEGIDTACGGLHLLTPLSADTNISKLENNAFSTKSNLSTYLHDNKITHLLMMGFNAGACVYASVDSAIRKGFDITVISDAVGQDNGLHGDINKYLRKMQVAGAKIFTSSSIISALKK